MPILPAQSETSTYPAYAIRRDKIVWITDGHEDMKILLFCNLPREALKFDDRSDADDFALSAASANNGHLFEVWNMDTMQKLTVVMFAAE